MEVIACRLISVWPTYLARPAVSPLLFPISHNHNAEPTRRHSPPLGDPRTDKETIADVNRALLLSKVVPPRLSLAEVELTTPRERSHEE